MSFEEKMGLTMMMELIEGELEERKAGSPDRRQKDCEESMKELTESERRSNEDRRSTTS